MSFLSFLVIAKPPTERPCFSVFPAFVLTAILRSFISGFESEKDGGAIKKSNFSDKPELRISESGAFSTSTFLGAKAFRKLSTVASVKEDERPE